MRSFRRTLRRAICFGLGGFIVFRRSGDLASTRSPIEQFRQPCEIDCNLSRVVDHQEAGMSCHVRVGAAIEKAELPASGVMDGKSVWEFDDPPWSGKAAGHVERGSGDLASTRSPIEQFRQPCEIDCNLSRVVHHQDAGMSCHVRVGPIEKAELPASGVMYGKSVWEFDDPPRPRKAAGHVEILRGRKPRRTDDAETEGRIPKERTMARRLGWVCDGAAK